jgi:LEA14-like dessication related protein
VNYTELVAAIKGYCENDFPTTAGSFTSTDQVNTFIKQAEQRIYNSVQFPAIRKT